MDVQFWIWLIVIVITLIARASKKKAAPGEPDSRPRRTSSQSDDEPKPVSFEDLLREIQAAKAPKPVVQSPPKKQEYTNYDDEWEEAEVLERADYQHKKADYSQRKDDEIYSTYEKAKQEAFNRPSLEETLKIEDTKPVFGHFKGYERVEKKNVAAELVKELKSPSGVKKAIILTEILGRRF